MATDIVIGLVHLQRLGSERTRSCSRRRRILAGESRVGTSLMQATPDPLNRVAHAQGPGSIAIVTDDLS